MEWSLHAVFYKCGGISMYQEEMIISKYNRLTE